jgi:ubiquinone/menaquinone biosynthesis C-methylase UbiE
MSEWELRLVDLAIVQRALDAGCGTGNFLLPLAQRLAAQGASVVGLDLAAGTLGVARARAAEEGLPVTCVIGDVEALPFEDSTFDLILANYMLYHLPDLDRGIAQLRRVMRAGGTLLAATNGARHMRELWELAEQACLRAELPPDALAALAATSRQAAQMSFNLETGGEWLRRHFTEVRLERYPDELRVTEVEPLVAYFSSMWTVDLMTGAVTSQPDAQRALREQVVQHFREVAAERVASEGVVRIGKDTGVFVAR